MSPKKRHAFFVCSQDDVIASSSSFRSIRSKARVQPKRCGYGAENAYHRLDDYLPCFFVFHNSKKPPSKSPPLWGDFFGGCGFKFCLLLRFNF